MSEAPIWTPDPARAGASAMRAFLDAQRDALAGDDYAALHAWSVARPDAFWRAVWDTADVVATTRGSAIVENIDRMPGARWFPGATLNYAENLLRRGHKGTAIVAVDERGRREEIRFEELRARVASFAAFLESVGVEPGDRVAACMPNRAETVVAALATAAIGAVWSSCPPEFGPAAILDRFGQIRPKVLVACTRARYNGRTFDLDDTLAEVCAALGPLAAVVLVGDDERTALPAGIPNGIDYAAVAGTRSESRFRPLPFAHPLAILYSSGTTGRPKCIVHGAGGTLLQHFKEHRLHTDIGSGDVVFYYTSCGWMMWNWLVSVLACGATIVLYDGAPMYPDAGALWRLAERERISVFGTSAKYLSVLEQSGCAPRESAELRALKTILSTGSPLAPEQFDFVYRDVKADVQLASIAGGTDIVSCFALGNPLLPVHRGELQCRGLGMKVEVFDDDGRSIVGRKGELVCTAPFPSMPLYFYGDTDGSRYRASYFERFPGVWHHGDYVELTEHGGVRYHGRSDAVLNPGGVRIGTAEIYRVVEQLPDVAEAVAIGQEREGDTRVVLFVRLAGGAELDESLRELIRARLRRDASPRHVPAVIAAVDDIPRTHSGKLVELAIRDVVHGRDVVNLAAIANPEALEQYRARPELDA